MTAVASLTAILSRRSEADLGTAVESLRLNAGQRSLGGLASLYAGVLSDRMGLDGEVAAALTYIFERWDGRGMPNGVGGEDIPAEIHSEVIHVVNPPAHVEEIVSPSEKSCTCSRRTR